MPVAQLSVILVVGEYWHKTCRACGKISAVFILENVMWLLLCYGFMFVYAKTISTVILNTCCHWRLVRVVLHSTWLHCAFQVNTK